MNISAFIARRRISTLVVLVISAVGVISILPFLVIPPTWHMEAVVLLTGLVGGLAWFFTGRWFGDRCTGEKSKGIADYLFRGFLALLLFGLLVLVLAMVNAGIRLGAEAAHYFRGIQAHSSNLNTPSGLPGNELPVWLLALRGSMPLAYVGGIIVGWRKGIRERTSGSA